MSRDLPWASVFDPGANLRAFSAIQAEGLRAASKLVDRFVQTAAAGLNPTSGAPADSQDQRADLWGATDIAPLLTSWWAMVNQLVGGAGMTPTFTAAADDSAAIDVSAASVTGRLELAVDAGATATAEVWLHNRGGDDLADVVLRCSRLTAGDGRVMHCGEVRFDPGVVPLPRRSSRGVEVTVGAGAEVAPGWYLGNVWVDGRPELGVALALNVRPPAP